MQEDSNPDSASTRPWGWLGTFGFGVLILGATYAVSYLVYICYFTYGYDLGLPTLDGSPAFNGFLVAITSLIIMPVMLSLLGLCIFFRKGISFNDYIGLKPIAISSFFQWSGVLWVFLIISEMVSWLIGRPYMPEFITQVYLSAESPALLLVALTIAVPITEEFFFRGFLLTGFHVSPLGWKGAIIVCALIWSLIHIQYDWFDISWVFVMGLLLGLAKKDTGSIYMPVIMHAMINAMAFFGVAAYMNNQDCMTVIQEIQHQQAASQVHLLEHETENLLFTPIRILPDAEQYFVRQG